MDLQFKWVGGATWILGFDGYTIACDPVLCEKGHVQKYTHFSTTRLEDPRFDEHDFENVDTWLLTHDHEDHIDEPGFAAISRGSKIICHESVEAKLKEHYLRDYKVLAWQEKTTLQWNGGTISVKAIPAFHARNRSLAQQVGNGNGYLVEGESASGRFSIYVTGDARIRPDIIQMIGQVQLDLVIVNAGAAHVGSGPLSFFVGRITQNRKDIVRLMKLLKPRNLIPVHWGTFSHYRQKLSPKDFAATEGIHVITPGEGITISIPREKS